jgi:hypothetical protein
MEDDMHLCFIAQTTSRNAYVKASSMIAVVGSTLLLGSMAGCAFFQALHQCGISECPGDAKITADVEARFHEHASTEPPNAITVSTFNGVVYLGGNVASASAKAEAD